MNKILIAIILINLWICKKVNCNTSVALFFDPISLKDNTYHFKIIKNKKYIVDTAIRSIRVDRSILIKCFDAEEIDSLTIVINNKIRTIKPDSFKQKTGPTSIFTYYDDRVILDSLFQSYTKRSIKMTGKIPVYREFADSLTAHNSVTSKFDSLMIYVKKDKCWCDSHNH